MTEKKEEPKNSDEAIDKHGESLAKHYLQVNKKKNIGAEELSEKAQKSEKADTEKPADDSA